MGLLVNWTFSEERISELKPTSIETSKTEKQRNRCKNSTEYLRTVEQLQKV